MEGSGFYNESGAEKVEHRRTTTVKNG